MNAKRILLAIVLIAGVYSQVGESADSKTISQLKGLYLRPTKIPYPPENEYTKARETLGKALFFDPRLSGSNAISCATCHNPSFAWGDGLAKGVGHGHKALGRRSPTILNLAWSPLHFWDGRAESLEEQALGPIASEGEMNMKLDNLAEKIQNIEEYKPMFKEAYPGEAISNQTIAKAIATYERTVVSGKSRFDTWVSGNDKALTEMEQRGFKVFNTKGNCAACHSGWAFTDGSFHDIGVNDDDIGRGKFLPKITIMQHAFKTPTLRNVDRRAPYMHDGSEKTLEDVVEFYNLGGKAKRESLAFEIKPLNLSAGDKKDLIAFLKTLTSVDKAVELPMLPK